MRNTGLCNRRIWLFNTDLDLPSLTICCVPLNGMQYGGHNILMEYSCPKLLKQVLTKPFLTFSVQYKYCFVQLLFLGNTGFVYISSTCFVHPSYTSCISDSFNCILWDFITGPMSCILLAWANKSLPAFIFYFS